VAHAGAFTGEQILAVILFCIIVLAWVTMSDRIGMGIIALAGVFLYIATGLVQWPEINQRTNWGVVLLFAAAISLGVQLKNTGAALWLAQNLFSWTGLFFERWEVFQYALNIGITTVVVNILSSSATVAVLGPFFMNMGGDPVALGLTTALASSYGYFTSVGSPAIMIIFATGLVHARDLLRVGWKMVLISGTFLMLAIMYYWPLLLK